MEYTESTVLTAREVAAELGCSVQLVYKLVRTGHLQAIRVSASARPAIRFLADDVVRYLEEANGVHRADQRRPEAVTR